MPARTDKVPNTSATAASAGTDLNGAAVLDACTQLCRRLNVIDEGRNLPFPELCEAAYRQRIPLFAQGYYRTPEIHWDPKTGRGKPFHYFTYGAAVSEVEVDGFTGMYRLLRTDILEDVGESISPIVDRGQIEGGFLQGVGWLTLEELLWDAEGRLATGGASTYKLPSWSELPAEFHVTMLEHARDPDVVFGSKAVGEPPLMLAISVREAIREAIAAFGAGGPVKLDSPATPERVFFALRAKKKIPCTAGCRHGRGGPTVTSGEILRATIFHTPGNAFRQETLRSFADGGLLVREGRIAACGGFSQIREAHPDAAVRDLRGGFLLPGFVDTHIHFPQVRVIGSLGRSLLEWLEHSALPEESRMADARYAEDTARIFVQALISNGTTTALVFGSHFAPATRCLFEAAARPVYASQAGWSSPTACSGPTSTRRPKRPTATAPN